MPTPPRERGHPALEVSCAEPAADLVSGILFAAGTSGIEELAPGRLRASFVTAPGDSVLRQLRALAASVRRTTIPAHDWVQQARRLARPVRVGALLVVPPWSRARAGAGEIRLVIDPARAFGTGSHESTRLVLAELDHRPPRRRRVLDVGTGSGILALAALALGAEAVVAIDVDPEATAAVRANARRNRRERGLHVVTGGPGALGGGFHVVLANLTAPLHAALADDIAARVGPGGRLVAAGLLEREEEGVIGIYAVRGLPLAGRSREGGWSCLRFARPRGRRS